MDTTFLREISLLVRSPKKGIDEIFWFGTLERESKLASPVGVLPIFWDLR